VSAAFTFPTPQRAQAALTQPETVLAAMTRFPPRDVHPVEPAPTIGDEAVLLHAANINTAIVVWRFGTVVAATWASTYTRSDEVAQAVRLAAVQQQRIAAPTPLDLADNDDLEVPLDNPHLDVPVYWLGRTLPAHGRLPALRLRAVDIAENWEVRSGTRPSMTYGTSSEERTVTVGLLHPRALRRPSERRKMRSLLRDPCTANERIALPDGHAKLVWPIRGCRSGFPFPFAVAVLPGVAVVILPGTNTEYCTRCSTRVALYSLRSGMRRLVRALVPRQRRDLAP